MEKTLPAQQSWDTDAPRPMTAKQLKDAEETLLTAKQVAEYFGVSIPTVYAWMHADAIQYTTINKSGKTTVGRYYITEAEIDRIDTMIGIREVKLALRRYLPRMSLRYKKTGRY